MKSHLNQFKVTLSESKENTNEIGGTQTIEQRYERTNSIFHLNII